MADAWHPAGVADDRAAARVRAWLLLVAVLVAGIVLIGGATRLTDSGLSITEWRPVTGVLLPLSEEAWIDEFIRYQGIPEYQIVNQGMSIDEFKTIYLWEWVHRNFGRLVGAVFLIPFIWFLATRQVRGPLAVKLVGIFCLGALQGFVGWYMVQSGLSEGVDVSQYRLAMHLSLAFLIFGAVSWTMFGLMRPREVPSGISQSHRVWAAVLLGLVFLQIIAGALVAGLRAGHVYNTWPLMDGELLPDGLAIMAPWYLNFLENALTVQFDHRVLAYVLVVAAIWHAVRMSTAAPGSAASASARMVAVLVVLQAALGIATLLLEVPIVLGLAHQAGAILVFGAALRHLYVVRRAPRAMLAHTAASA